MSRARLDRSGLVIFTETSQPTQNVTVIGSGDGDIHEVVEDDYAMLATDYTVLVTTGGVDRTITLPVPALNKKVRIKNVDGGGKVLVEPNASELIEGVSGYTIEYQGGFVEFLCNGTDWFTFGIGQ